MTSADCIYWFFILIFSLPVKGHEACFGNSSTNWQYDSHTHTCFELNLVLRKWTEARDYCRQVQLGNNFGVTTHLAKIDDNITNDLLSFGTILNPAWIGLHYVEEKGDFRWDGYPDEKPKYESTFYRTRQKPYFIVFPRQWQWVGQNGDMKHFSVCQQPAKTISTVTCDHDVLTDGIRIKCTSEESPVKAKCQWTYKYDVDTNFLPWRPINDCNHEFQIHDATGGNISYTTTCSTILTEDNTNMTIGTLMFKMKMYPDIKVSDISTNQNAQTIASLNIDVGTQPKGAESYTSPSENGPIVDSSSSLSTVAIIGLVLGSDVVVIVLTILLMIASRKLREKRDKPQTSHNSTSGGVKSRFHKAESESSESIYVTVTENAQLPGREFLTLSRNTPEEGIYEGEEMQDMAGDTSYENAEDKTDSHDILHPDDPIYVNLNTAPSRQYANFDH